MLIMERLDAPTLFKIPLWGYLRLGCYLMNGKASGHDTEGTEGWLGSQFKIELSHQLAGLPTPKSLGFWENEMWISIDRMWASDPENEFQLI